MEKSETQTENLEKNISPENQIIVSSPLSKEEINTEINNISNKININQETIIFTTQKVGEVRENLGLIGEEKNIPSIEFNKKNISNLENKKIDLENKLSDILKSDVSEKYKEEINQIKQSKIDWANSSELERRLKLKGADEQDLVNIKEWLINNVNNTKSFILPPQKFKEVLDIIAEMTGDEEIKQGDAFHATERSDIPENIRNSIFMKETLARPPMPGQNVLPENYINKTTLSHELGHATQDGLLNSEQFKNGWNPKFKKGAPDKEYIGQIQETDTRIRSMFNTLGDSLNIENEVFGKKHLEILRDKLNKGILDKDTKDLLEHYNDIDIIKMANRMPAI